MFILFIFGANFMDFWKFDNHEILQFFYHQNLKTFDVDIEKSLKDSRKPVEESNKGLKHPEKKKEISDKVRKAKFLFNTRGKINKKESKELIRTHTNIFDWVK